MDRAKLAIKASVKQWEKYWEVIDRRWEGQLHKHLHVAGLPTNEEGRERDVDSVVKVRLLEQFLQVLVVMMVTMRARRGGGTSGAIEELVALVRVLGRWLIGVVPHAKDIAPSKSLPSVGYSRKSYPSHLPRLARGKLVHFHGWKSLALPSVGREKWCLRDFADTQEGCEIFSQQQAKLLPSRGICRATSEGDTPYCTKRLRNHFATKGKCSKSGCYDCHQEYALWQILFAFLLAIRIYSWQMTSKLFPRFLKALLSLDLLW
ncbi:hypothetical protein AAG906_004783 [Vitis piasezkii]